MFWFIFTFCLVSVCGAETLPALPAPSFPWHLDKLNVFSVWNEGIRGNGVVVCIIDDGIETSHNDLIKSLRLDLSWDLALDSANAGPKLPTDRHGTRCAGQIVAQSKCNSGVAPEASISAIRLLGDENDGISVEREVQAVTWLNQANHIYSCSWGPADDGRSVEGPANQVLRAFIRGLAEGRMGLGSIFIFAAGNGGKGIDNCNFDGYANAPFSITIGAVDINDETPSYMEECSAMLAVTYSSSTSSKNKVYTSDLNNSCSSRHGGTSAAAPFAAGLVALLLSDRDDLSWRDVQHIIVNSAVPFKNQSMKNAAGRYFSEWFGFGKLDAERMIEVGREWEPVPDLAIISSKWRHERKLIKCKQVCSQIKIKNTSKINTIEHVMVTVDLKMLPGTFPRGNLIFSLKSLRTGTMVALTSRRRRDLDSDRAGLRGWTFGTVAFWDEPPSDAWELFIDTDNTDSDDSPVAELKAWKVSIFGSSTERRTKFDELAFFQALKP